MKCVSWRGWLLSLRAKGECMQGRPHFPRAAARWASSIVLLQAAFASYSAPSVAAPTSVPATSGPAFIGVAADEKCQLGVCPPTAAEPAPADVTTPISFVTVLANGDRFEVTGFDEQVNQCGSAGFHADTKLAVMYIGNGSGTPSQGDKWALDIYHNWICSPPASSFTYRAIGTFSPSIAPGSAVDFTGDGMPPVHVGPFFAPEPFFETPSTTPIAVGDVVEAHSTFTLTFAPNSPVGSYITLGPPAPIQTLPSPMRVVDTRTLGAGPIASGTSRCFTAAGLAGIPSNAGAVVLNVTAVGYGTNGWLTVYPNGQSVPATSTLNFDVHEYAIANGAIMRIGTGGQVCVNVGTVGSAPGSSDVVLDVTGYLTSGDLVLLPMLASPQRIADTRTGGGQVTTGTSRCFPVAGVAGVPSDAAAVVVNVTAVGYSRRGWLTAYPNGQPVPATSTVNFDTTEYAIANGSIVPIGTGGQMCVNVGTVSSAPGSSDVVLDVTGYLTANGPVQMPMLSSPQRVGDTRTSGGPVASGQSRCFNIAGLVGIPSTAGAVVLNVTAVGYSQQGWLTAYPNGQSVPPTSTLNFDTTEYAMANGAVIGVGTGGQVCINVGTVGSAPGNANIIIDVLGYLSSEQNGSTPTPRRHS